MKARRKFKKRREEEERQLHAALARPPRGKAEELHLTRNAIARDAIPPSDDERMEERIRLHRGEEERTMVMQALAYAEAAALRRLGKALEESERPRKKPLLVAKQAAG